MVLNRNFGILILILFAVGATGVLAAETDLEAGTLADSYDTDPLPTSDVVTINLQPSSQSPTTQHPAPTTDSTGTDSTGTDSTDGATENRTGGATPLAAQRQFKIDEEVPEELFPTILDEKTKDDHPLLSGSHRELLDNPAEREKAKRLIEIIRDSENDPRGAYRDLTRSNVERFIVQFNKSCDLSQIPEMAIRREIETDRFIFMIIMMPRPLLRPLIKNGCVLKVADPENKEAFFAYAKRVLSAETREKIREMRLQRSSHDATGYNEIVEQLQSEWDRAKGEHSPLQEFVTPESPSIMTLAAGSNPERLYDEALSWLWISDQAFWGEPERWIKPEAFLTKTPGAESNPRPGRAASDCSEQANTLVSLLRASGVSAKDVRVAMGEVEFGGGGSGGHAWAEMRIDDTWVVLDGTVGAYYDEETGELLDRESLPFAYWKYHEFPIIEVWTYYNDEYFLDVKEKHAPSDWGDAAGNLFEKDMNEGLKISLWERILLFLAKIVGKFM